ncbi:MAG: hypothetical protein QM770_04680 [Tepidisphaeraceae bacterium]
MSVSSVQSSQSARAGFVLLLGLILLLMAGKAVLVDNLDPDFFWHLRVAEQLHRDGVRPLVDSISYSSIREPWTPYSWLAELAMKAVWDAGGLPGVLVTQAGLLMSYLGLIALTARELVSSHPPLRGRVVWGGESHNVSESNSDSPPPLTPPSRGAESDTRFLATIVATFFAAFAAYPYLSFRPLMFALVLLACVAWLIARDRHMVQRSRTIWLVPVLTAVLINVHLYAIFVPVWLGAIALGDLIEHRRLPWRSLALTALAGFACCATPLLPGVLAQVLSYQSSDVMVREGRIAEMQPIWTGVTGCIVLAGCAATLLALTKRTIWFPLPVRREKVRVRAEPSKSADAQIAHPPALTLPSPGLPGEGEMRGTNSATGRLWLIAWCLISLLFMLRLGRFAPVGVIVFAPVMACVLPRLRDAVLAGPTVRFALSLVLVLGLVRVLVSIPSTKSLDAWLTRFGADVPGYPVQAAKFVDERVTSTSGRLINEFTWGGYLGWRLGDRYQVLLDGRTQLFSESFWRATYLRSEADSASVLSDAHADAAIVPVKKSRFRSTLQSLGWTVAHEDDVAVVMLPPTMPQANAK